MDGFVPAGLCICIADVGLNENTWRVRKKKKKDNRVDQHLSKV